MIQKFESSSASTSNTNKRGGVRVAEENSATTEQKGSCC